MYNSSNKNERAINLTKHIQELYAVNYMMMKEISKSAINVFSDWKTQCRKDVSSPKLIKVFNAIPIKIPAGVSVDLDKVILKFIWKDKGIRVAKRILKRKNNVEGITLLNFKNFGILQYSRQYGIGKGTDT